MKQNVQIRKYYFHLYVVFLSSFIGIFLGRYRGWLKVIGNGP